MHSSVNSNVVYGELYRKTVFSPITQFKAVSDSESKSYQRKYFQLIIQRLLCDVVVVVASMTSSKVSHLEMSLLRSIDENSLSRHKYC